MFDLQYNLKGEKVLVYTERSRYPGERGLWVDIGRDSDKNIKAVIEFNRRNGVEVEMDEHGFWRALVLKD